MNTHHIVKVIGGGSKTLPAGIALPGGYKNTDPGLLTQLWCTSHNASLAFLLDPDQTTKFIKGTVLVMQLRFILLLVVQSSRCKCHLVLLITCVVIVDSDYEMLDS